MSSIKIEITVDSTNAQIITALSALMNGTPATQFMVNAPEVVEPKDEKPAPAKRRAKAPAKAPEPIEEDEDEDNDDLLGNEEDEDESEELTEEDVKAMLTSKVNANRDAIVKKLRSLDASKLSDLDKKHYAEFHSFLSKLK